MGYDIVKSLTIVPCRLQLARRARVSLKRWGNAPAATNRSRRTLARGRRLMRIAQCGAQLSASELMGRWGFRPSAAEFTLGAARHAGRGFTGALLPDPALEGEPLRDDGFALVRRDEIIAIHAERAQDPSLDRRVVFGTLA